jgi:DNA-binding PadR family transcriptional regulator
LGALFVVRLFLDPKHLSESYNPSEQRFYQVFSKTSSSGGIRRKMATTSIISDVKGFELADLGKKRIEWANQSMKVLQIIRKEFIKNQPLKGIRVSACLHVTAKPQI